MKSIIEQEYQVSSIGEFFGDYSEITLDEYFSLLDNEPQKHSVMVAKSLAKYLKSKKQLCNIAKASI